MRYVALLRGINVGGKNMIKMEKLREVIAELGFDNVASYVNSGNLAFDCRSPRVSKGLTLAAALANKIHGAIEKEFGFNISVMVRSREEIENVVANNPYEGKFDSHKDLHVFFLNSELSEEHEKALMDLASDNEMMAVRGREIYYLLRISILDSALGKGFLDKKLKVPATARNWRTVEKLVGL